MVLVITLKDIVNIIEWVLIIGFLALVCWATHTNHKGDGDEKDSN